MKLINLFLILGLFARGAFAAENQVRALKGEPKPPKSQGPPKSPKDPTRRDLKGEPKSPGPPKSPKGGPSGRDLKGAPKSPGPPKSPKGPGRRVLKGAPKPKSKGAPN